MNVVTDDMVQAALDAYSENEWRTSASAMRAALAAVLPLARRDERGVCCKALEEMSAIEKEPARASALLTGAATIRLVASIQNRAAAIRQEPGHE